MRTRELLMSLRRPAMILITVICAAVTPAAAQQAPDSTRLPEANAVKATAVPSAPSVVLVGPRIPPRFQRVEPILPRSNGLTGSSAAAAAGQHTIVISTLAVVLISIIVVLLVVK